MSQIAMLIWLMVFPAPAEATHEMLAQHLAAQPDPCALAEQVAAQPPCLNAEDCGALREWKRVFGQPQVQLLNPSVARVETPGGARVLGSQGFPARELPPTYMCPAGRTAGRR